MRKKITLFLLMFLITIPLYANDVMDTTKAVIHHSASKDVSAKIIDKWQRKKGWKEIGYHFVIRENGNIEVGRPLSKIGAHAKNPNRNNYIGICLTGYDKFTQAQLKSLDKLIDILGIRNVERHHEECPGKGINIEVIQEELNRKHLNGHCYERYGKATYYQDLKTANGENMYLQPWAKTCATWLYPIGAILRVSNLGNNKSVVVRVNDRGPNENLLIKKDRIIDLSKEAFKALDNLDIGEINVGIVRIK